MSDTAIAEAPAEPVPPSPEAAAALDAAPPQAAEAPGAPVPEQPDATAPQDDSERRGLPSWASIGRQVA